MNLIFKILTKVEKWDRAVDFSIHRGFEATTAQLVRRWKFNSQSQRHNAASSDCWTDSGLAYSSYL